MKHLLLLLSFGISLSLIAQSGSTVNITSSQYNLLKQSGNLDLTKKYVFTDASPASAPVKYKGEARTPSSICSCMVPLDSTFSLVPFGSWGFPDFRNDDASTGLIGLPFSFNLYGVNYDSLYINNNGNISFSSPYSTFTANPFPDPSYKMIAPFWGDVDTRDTASGLVYYQITSTHLIVKWENVGYYSMMTDKLNTFQLIITDGTDTLLPAGTNVSFCYGDMQWTTGMASGGISGFGGVPATVGVNEGNTMDYFQVGTFDNPGTLFDGPYNSADQVDWLDNQGMYFNTAITGNIPPVIINNNICDTIDVYTGDTLRTVDIVNFMLGASTPELGQTINVSITCSEPTALTYTQTMNTNTYKQYDCTFSAVGLSPDLYTVTITATDDGTPAQTTSRSVFIRTNYDPSVMTSIAEKPHTNDLTVHPNPGNGIITIKHQVNANLNPVLLITDVLGKNVLSVNLDSSQQQIDISSLPQGIYFATISSKEGSGKTIKIVKK
jgi:hypothetical protein